MIYVPGYPALISAFHDDDSGRTLFLVSGFVPEEEGDLLCSAIGMDPERGCGYFRGALEGSDRWDDPDFLISKLLPNGRKMDQEEALAALARWWNAYQDGQVEAWGRATFDTAESDILRLLGLR